MKESVYAGIDIGGTKISALITKANGTIVGRAKKKSRGHKGAEAVLDRAVDCFREALESAKLTTNDVEVVGVGAPSPILPDGTAVAATNLGWKMVPVAAILSKKLGLPVYAENDCNVGTFGEFALGGHGKARTLIGLFVGTGLGGGIIRHGELITGDNSMAAEIGHMTVSVDGRLCGCGKRGCIEAYASKRGMGQGFKQAILVEGQQSILEELQEGADLSNVRSSVLRKAWLTRDAVTREGVSTMARYLGVAIGNLITVLGPEVVVLGGGVLDALGKELLSDVRKAAREHTFPTRSFEDTKIELATLGDDAVALGAMAYGRWRHDQRPQKLSAG